MVNGDTEEVEETRVPVPWGVIAAKCWYPRTGRPVLAMHGLNENAGSFDRLIPMLSRDFHYVVVDLPGHGFSTSFPDGLPLSFMSYVHQLQWVVRHFRWETFVLMGHSFGAHIAEFYAATFPSQIEKLILLEGCSPTPVPKEIFLVSYSNQMRDILKGRPGPPKTYTYPEALALTMNGRWSKLNAMAAVALLDRALTKTPDGRYTFATDLRHRWEIRPGLDQDTLLHVYRRIRCPVLVVLGAESELRTLHAAPGFFRSVLDVLARSHRASRIVRVDGNHCLHNNNPEAVAPVIGRFLRSRSNL